MTLRMRSLPVVVSLCAVLLLAAEPVAAQILYGSIVGNVKDSSEAAVSGATVTITHKESNQTRQTVTNEVGGYTIPTLPPGTYDVRVTKEGFSAFTQSDVVVTINTVTRVDVALRVGAVTETVTVTSSAATLQTDRSEVRAEIGSRTFENLPVSSGRNYQQIFRILPGFRPPTNAHSVPTNPSRALTFNVNGASYSINNTRIDGASNNAPWLPHITGFVPTLDSIETVNVVSNSFDAEQGLAGGAAINVAIKSGTNQLHGSAFEFYSGNKLKAKNYFLPPGLRNPKLVFNEFGGSLGGPIKKDKLFYFMSYEGNFDREFASRFGSVPTPDMKRGDFSSSGRPIFNPLSGAADGSGRTAFDGARIPPSFISPITSKLNALIPDPNQAPGSLVNNYFVGGGYIFDRNRADTKVNYAISDKLNVFGRFSIMHYEMFNPTIFGDLGGVELSSAGGNPGNGNGNTYSFTGAVTYVLSPTLVLDAYYGFTQANTGVEQLRLDEKLGTDFLGIPGTNGSRRFEGGWPRFTIAGFNNLGINNDFMPYFRRDPQHQQVFNLNWTKKTHEVRFGFDFYQTGMNHAQPEATGALHGAQGGFGFTGGTTLEVVRQPNGTFTLPQSPNQFNSYASFLLGMPFNAGKITQVPDEYTTRSRQYSTYIRDRWNATRKLTISYGLRWEYFPFPTRADRGLELYDVNLNKMRVCGVGQVPENCGVQESKTKFAPRFGFAYRVSETFVIRAGYGITNDPFSLQRPFRTNYPVLLIQNLEGAQSWLPYDPRGIASGIPPVRVPDLGNGLIDVPNTFATITVADDFRRGYVQSWNFTLQKQFSRNWTAQAGYVATRSTAAMGYLNLNAGQVIGAGQAGRPFRQKFGRTANVTQVTPFGTNMYDSLQATLTRRFSGGMQVDVAYTWSKVIGYQDNNDSGPAVNALAYFDRNRTVRGYDRPHNLHISQVWELPFGKGRKWVSGGPLERIVGGWQVSNVFSFFDGTPFTVSSDGASLNMPNSDQTADQIKPAVQILGGVGRGRPYFDPDAFAPVRDPRFGNTAYNILRAPGYANWDFGLFKKFRITEAFHAELRMEAANFTNTPHFAGPSSTNVGVYRPTVADINQRYSGYTEILSTANSVGRDGVDERIFRIGLRLTW